MVRPLSSTTSIPQIAPASCGRCRMASMRRASDWVRAVAHAANSIAISGSNLRKRHLLGGLLQIAMHRHEHAVETGIRKARAQPLRDRMRFEAGAVVAGEGAERKFGRWVSSVA